MVTAFFSKNITTILFYFVWLISSLVCLHKGASCLIILNIRKNIYIAILNTSCWICNCRHGSIISVNSNGIIIHIRRRYLIQIQKFSINTNRYSFR